MDLINFRQIRFQTSRLVQTSSPTLNRTLLSKTITIGVIDPKRPEKILHDQKKYIQPFDEVQAQTIGSCCFEYK